MPKINGWQSWSPPKTPLLKVPYFLYPPTKMKPVNLKIKKIKLKKPIKGWCSWYNYGTNITEEKILRQAKAAQNKKIPINYVLIDDGWAKWGDWQKPDKRKFKNLKSTVSKINKLGFKAGIWLAPFLTDPDSSFSLKNKDWTKNTNPTTIHKYLPYSPIKRSLLDFKNPAARKYIYNSIDYLLGSLKFDLIKLDFLYAIYFHPEITNPEADEFLRDIFKYITKKYPHVYKIASGSPFTVLAGLTDSMRIGPDTIFTPFFKFKIPDFISNFYVNKTVVPSIKQRLDTRIYWNNDPDCFICGKGFGLKEKTILNLYDAISQAKGNIFLSDDLTKLTKSEINRYILPLLLQ